MAFSNAASVCLSAFWYSKLCNLVAELVMSHPFISILASVELVYLATFYLYIIPYANRPHGPPEPARNKEYHRQPHKLLVRIMKRIERRAIWNHQTIQQAFAEFLYLWFHHIKDDHQQEINNSPPETEASSVASTSSSIQNHQPDIDNEPYQPAPTFDTSALVKSKLQNPPLPILDEVKELVSWAFLGRNHYDDLGKTKQDEWELEECRNLMQVFHDFRIIFPTSRRPSSKERMVPRKMTHEPVSPIFRPLIVYLTVALVEFIGGLVLRYYGFRKYVSSHGSLSYWHRQGPSTHHPFIFFHGIAPAGITFYICMILNLYQNPPSMYLFENKCISYGMSLYPVSEANTSASVVEALRRHGDGHATDLTICGHSFGSFQVTWMIHHPVLRPLIRKVVLLEPVSILISDPDVMENFIYKRREHVSSWPTFINQSLKQTFDDLRQYIADRLIYWVASTEVYTEHYLRRHFVWYNFELWLDDVPPTCHVWVGLAEKDTIVNAQKVKDEIDMTNQIINETRITPHMWRDCGHADCLTKPDLWKDISTFLGL